MHLNDFCPVMKKPGITSRVRELCLLTPPDGLFVELGVAGGRHALKLLQHHPTMRYLGIDVWEVRPGNLALAQRRLRPFASRVTLRRCRFEEARLDVQNAALVYVDGFAHGGQENGQTLEQWWGAVMPGGVMAGHDYDTAWPATVQAVDEWAARCGVTIQVIPDRQFASWWVRKPLTSSCENSECQRPDE